MRFNIRVKTLLIIGFLALSGGWLSITLAVWIYVREAHNFTNARYFDLVNPFRWHAFQRARGDFYISSAEHLIKSGNFAAALGLLKNGVGKSPQNTKGRLLLAGIYDAMRRPDLAKAVFLDRLSEFTHDPGYLSAACDFFIQTKDDQLVISFFEDTRRQDNLPASSLHLLCLSAAQAAFNQGNYAMAEAYANFPSVGASIEAKILKLKITRERGFPELALADLRSLIASNSTLLQLRELEGNYLRDLGREQEWETVVIERMLANPEDLGARVDYLQILHKRGELRRANDETETFLREFKENPRALLLLADLATTTGLPELAFRAQQAIGSSNRFSGPAALMVVEANVAAGNYQAALDLIAGYQQSYPEWVTQFAPVFYGLQSVAYLGLEKKEEARLQLDLLVAQKNLRADNLVAISNRLHSLGADDFAITALESAVATDPSNELALNALISAMLESGQVDALEAHLKNFVKLPRPSVSLATRAYSILGSDTYLFSASHQPLVRALGEISSGSSR